MAPPRPSSTTVAARRGRVRRHAPARRAGVRGAPALLRRGPRAARDRARRARRVRGARGARAAGRRAVALTSSSSSSARGRCSRWSARRSRASRSRTRSRRRSSGSPSCCDRAGRRLPPRAERLVAAAGRGLATGTRRSRRSCSRRCSARCARAPPCSPTIRGSRAVARTACARRSPRPGRRLRSPCRCTCARSRSACSSRIPAGARSRRATSRCSPRSPRSSPSRCRTRGCTSARPSSARRSHGVLESERQTSRQVNALYEISRSFAQSLSLETTLDAVTTTIVEVLGVDAAVIRVPDERGDQFVPRAVHVAESRLDDAVRTILERPQPRPPRSREPRSARRSTATPPRRRACAARAVPREGLDRRAAADRDADRAARAS